MSMITVCPACGAKLRVAGEMTVKCAGCGAQFLAKPIGAGASGGTKNVGAAGDGRSDSAANSATGNAPDGDQQQARPATFFESYIRKPRLTIRRHRSMLDRLIFLGM